VFVFIYNLIYITSDKGHHLRNSSDSDVLVVALNGDHLKTIISTISSRTYKPTAF